MQELHQVLLANDTSFRAHKLACYVNYFVVQTFVWVRLTFLGTQVPFPSSLFR